jgi:DNA-binding winged helix-turn-helix (wHTH) protein
MAQASQKQYVFGDFILKPTERQLLQAGTALKLSPKSFNLLQLLIERAGSLVTEDEILKTLWPDEFISPQVINVRVSEIRKVLGDSVKNPKFIETVHTHGYRFCHLVEPLFVYETTHQSEANDVLSSQSKSPEPTSEDQERIDAAKKANRLGRYEEAKATWNDLSEEATRTRNEKLLPRPSVSWLECQPVSRSNVRSVYEFMRKYFGDESPRQNRILEWQQINRHILTAVYDKRLSRGEPRRELVGVFKILPLKEVAIELLESEEITGATIGSDVIAAEGEPVKALYIGDVVACTQQGKAEVLRQLKNLITRRFGTGIPVYTRPLTSHGARLVRKYGFLPVVENVVPGSVGRIHKFII